MSETDADPDVQRGDGYARVPIPQDAFEELKAQKEQTGESWGDVARRLSDNPPRLYVDAEALVAELDAVEELSDVADAVTVIEERTGRMERKLEELEAGR